MDTGWPTHQIAPIPLSLTAGQCSLGAASIALTCPTDLLVTFRCKCLFSAQHEHFSWQPRFTDSLPQSSPEQLSLQATQASVSSFAKYRRMFALSVESFLRSLGVPRDLIGIQTVKSHSRKEGRVVRSNKKDKCSGLQSLFTPSEALNLSITRQKDFAQFLCSKTLLSPLKNVSSNVTALRMSQIILATWSCQVKSAPAFVRVELNHS